MRALKHYFSILSISGFAQVREDRRPSGNCTSHKTSGLLIATNVIYLNYGGGSKTDFYSFLLDLLVMAIENYFSKATKVYFSWFLKATNVWF